MPSQHGAYGFRVSGIEGLERLLVVGEDDWPLFEVEVEVGESPIPREALDESSALLRLRTGGQISMDRAARRVVFTVPASLSADEVAHPYLAPVAAVVAYWHGRESLHAGGFLAGGAVWGIVGDRMGGKSSLLAALAARGAGVFTDDMLVIDGGEAFAGPRSIDLREDAAAALGIGTGIGVVGARPRWRVQLGDVPQRAPLAGWVFLDWATGVDAVRLPASETLTKLLRNRGIRLAPPDPSAFIHLSALPAWELRRPRSWDAVDAAVDRLLEAVS